MSDSKASPSAVIGTLSPMGEIIELDLGAIRALPPHTDIAAVPEVLGPHKEWVPRPLVWVEEDWAKKPFVYEASAESYRCVLHRLDGVRCDALVKTRSAGFGEPSTSALVDHLRAIHSIVEPVRPRRRWKHGLMSGLCTLACIDCMLAPCCFVGRMLSVNMDPQGDAIVASYTGGALGCGDSDLSFVCCCDGSDRPHMCSHRLPDSRAVCEDWCCVTPMGLVWFSFMPCYLCFGAAACLPDLQLRERVARKHNIDETKCERGMIVCFCCPCSDIQVHREIESAGVWPGYSCCSRNTPLRTPEEVQNDFNATTREGVVRSRLGYSEDIRAVALQAME